MHIVLGLLSGIAGVVWAFVALQRSGFSLDSLNPFAWYRRHQWLKTYGMKPIFNLREPVDVAGLLLLAVLKCEGEISAEQKRALLAVFETDFHLEAHEAGELLVASSHLLRNELSIAGEVGKVLEKSLPDFSPAKAESLLNLMQRLANLESPANEEQRRLIGAVEQYFRERRVLAPKSRW